MINFTKIIGSLVLSAHNCEVVGTVINMQTNAQNNKIKHLIISSNDDETTFILPANRIFRIADAVVIRNNTALSVTSDISVNSIINCQAITISGVALGKITEINLDDKLNIVSFNTEKEELQPRHLISIKNGIALFNDTDKKYSLSTFAPRTSAIPESSPDTLVHALNDEQNGNVSTPRTIIARLPKNFRLPTN